MISCRNDSMVCSCEAKDADEDLDNASTEAEDADEDHDDVSTEAANVDEDHEDRKHYNDESPYRNKCSHHYQRDYREDSFNDIFDIESADDDDEIESEDDEDGTETVSEDCWNDNNNSVILYSKPIVVGYAFGPKKMSTMGVVMAEASKTKLSASSYSTATSENTTSLFNSVESPHTAILPLICNAQSTKDCDNTIVNSENMQVTPDKSEPISPSHVYQSNDYPDESVCHSPNMQELARQRNDDWSVKKRSCAKKRAVNRRNAQCDDSITFTIDGRVIHDNNNAATSNLRSIVRRFRSSCSSVGSTTDDACSSTATGTFTASSQQTGTTCGARTSNSGSRKSHPYNNTGSSKERLIPVRVSFVPLDPDFPLEEQHGGKLDVILHKLTEDILCLSQLAMENPTLKEGLKDKIINNFEAAGINADHDDEQAIQRVFRVTNFHRMNPECCLVDDPAKVLTLMSRADIADTLQRCLLDVSSTSGIPVGSPLYAVLAPPYGCSSAPIVSSGKQRSTEIDFDWLNEKVSKLSYPIIVKPLSAAGTKASHAMAVIMNPAALHRLASEKAPCLLQEYSNHDAVLYKVYVLGNHVSVHKRRSLPNLPISTQCRLDHVEFDSQRPYPRLSDFGYPDENELKEQIHVDHHGRHQRVGNVHSLSSTCLSDSSQAVVTVDEIRPIVDALKLAFGLELFGFDVLITSSSSGSRLDEDNTNVGGSAEQYKCTRKMLVIDVNYFPSYKEVTNFPALLAKYLTDRVLDSRRQSKQLEHQSVSRTPLDGSQMI